ncbi:hypothetical protein [Gordonia hirsuta]|nr:hypothetical protein [Gordonia hirsuta]
MELRIVTDPMRSDAAFSSREAGAAASRIETIQLIAADFLGSTLADRDPDPLSAQIAPLDAEFEALEQVGDAVAEERVAYQPVPRVRGRYSPTDWQQEAGVIRGETGADGRELPGVTGPWDFVGDRRPPTALSRAQYVALQEQTSRSASVQGFRSLLEHMLAFGPTTIERVASAQILDSLARGAHASALEVLEQAIRSPYDDIRFLAEVSSVGDRQPVPESGHADSPGSPGGRTGGDPLPDEAEDADDGEEDVSFTLHGTWRRLTIPSWYRPGEPLHGHIRNCVSPELYVGADYPRWSGGYSDIDRAQGARMLLDWVQRRRGSLEVEAIYAHSHGGNVALEAAAQGLKVKMLVLLHVPPRPRSGTEWAAIRSNVERTMVYRVHQDLIVLADVIYVRARGGRMNQRFDQSLLPHIDSSPPPITGPRFRHGHYTKVDNWVGEGLDSDIDYYRRLGPM